MGTSYWADLTYGILVEYKQVNRQVKHFDELTGKSYIKTVKEWAWICQGKDVSRVQWEGEEQDFDEVLRITFIV